MTVIAMSRSELTRLRVLIDCRQRTPIGAPALLSCLQAFTERTLCVVYKWQIVSRPYARQLLGIPDD